MSCNKTSKSKLVEGFLLFYLNGFAVFFFSFFRGEGVIRHMSCFMVCVLFVQQKMQIESFYI